MAAEEDFLQPIELLLPHAFHPTDGHESVVMLGARAGAIQWTPLPIGAVKDIGGPDEEGIAHLKVRVRVRVRVRVWVRDRAPQGGLALTLAPALTFALTPT